MGADTVGKQKSGFAAVISLGKDFVSLLRDGALFILAFLLVVFPAQFNSILINAGFQEGSIAGFKWKQNLVDSNDELEKAQVTISGLQNKNDELVKTLAEAKSQLEDKTLQNKITRQTSENQQLKNKTRVVQSTVSKTLKLNAPLVEKALSTTSQSRDYNNADFTIGLQTLGITDEERISINSELKSRGYNLDTISWSYAADDRPSWFAYESTVFYYSTSSRVAAKQLATTLKTVTGKDFGIQRGAGLGVEPDQKDTTLFIHYLDS